MAISDHEIRKITSRVGDLIEPLHEQIVELRNLVEEHTNMLESLETKETTASNRNISKHIDINRIKRRLFH